MYEKIQISKLESITHFWIYFVIIPLIAGAIIGFITAKIRPNVIMLTLAITGSLSLILLMIVGLTLKNQAIPQLAIMLAVLSVVILNISAVVAHKVSGRKL